MSFGERLKGIREEAGLSQEEFAEKFSVSRQSVSKWERNDSYPHVETLLYIARSYSLSLDDLFQDELHHSQLPDENPQWDFLSKSIVPALQTFAEQADKIIYYAGGTYEQSDNTIDQDN